MLSDLNVDKFLADKPLALTLAGLEELRGHIFARLSLFDADPRGTAQQFAAGMTQRAQPSRGRPRTGATGVIQIRGAISQHEANDLSTLLFGGASTEAVSAQLREYLADDSIANILLDIDSPGGTVFGVAELAQEIRDARATKPIAALANSVAASAAYWLACQCDQFWATTGAQVGSIGVYGIHQDVSKMLDNEGVKTTLISAGKHKVDGNPFEPLPDDVRAAMQERVDETYAMFVADVARGRGVPEASVRNGYGEGAVVSAKQAKALGMIDGIYTLDQALAKIATLRPASTGSGQKAELFAEAPVEEPEAPAREEIIPDVEGQQRLAALRWRVLKQKAGADRVAVEV